MTGQALPWEPPSHVRWYESGYEKAMFDIARLVLDLRDGAASDATQVDAVLSLIQLRLAAGAEDPVGQLTGDGG